MPEVRRVGDLEVGQDLAYQRREWAFERCGWAAMALVGGLALLGLFGGGGPLSDARVGTADGALHVEYQRFLRRDAPGEMKVRLGAGPTGEARLWVERAYLDTFRLREVRPAPDRVEAAPGRLVLTFRREAGAAVPVVFFVEPRRPGRSAGRLGAGGAEVAVSHFIYP